MTIRAVCTLSVFTFIPRMVREQFQDKLTTFAKFTSVVATTEKVPPMGFRVPKLNANESQPVTSVLVTLFWLRVRVPAPWE